MILYGIKNCDRCKKARRRLDEQEKQYTFHDFRSDGLDRDTLERFEAALGWEKLLNTRSTTWRALPASDKAGLDREKALALMLKHPALIKRPLLENNATILIGFDPETYRT